MANPYFRQVPDFQYVNVLPNSDSARTYINVKNLFKRGKIRDEIFKNLNYFTKYVIIGDERPDNIAYKIYDDPTLDWVILLSNNIINSQSEWPLPQDSIDEILLDKYRTYDNLYNGVHHYETIEQKDSRGFVIMPGGIHVDQDFSIEYYSNVGGGQVLRRNITRPITNYEYEIGEEEKKRTIYIFKAKYLNVLFNDIEKILPYKKGSEQFVSKTLKRADNIRLYT